MNSAPIKNAARKGRALTSSFDYVTSNQSKERQLRGFNTEIVPPVSIRENPPAQAFANDPNPKKTQKIQLSPIS
jgi:hypothetical protein